MSVRSIRNLFGAVLFCLVSVGIQQGKVLADSTDGNDFWSEGCYFHWIFSPFTIPPPTTHWFNGYCPESDCDHAAEACFDVCDNHDGGYVSYFECSEDEGTAAFLCYCHVRVIE